MVMLIAIGLYFIMNYPVKIRDFRVDEGGYLTIYHYYDNLKYCIVGTLSILASFIFLNKTLDLIMKKGKD
jgi:anaerobic C4-dicarboxylate transporter